MPKLCLWSWFILSFICSFNYLFISLFSYLHIYSSFFSFACRLVVHSFILHFSCVLFTRLFIQSYSFWRRHCWLECTPDWLNFITRQCLSVFWTPYCHPVSRHCFKELIVQLQSELEDKVRPWKWQRCGVAWQDTDTQYTDGHFRQRLFDCVLILLPVSLSASLLMPALCSRFPNWSHSLLCSFIISLFLSFSSSQFPPLYTL